MKMKWLVGVCVTLASTVVAAAVDGTWLSTSAGGNWDDSANWTNGTMPGDGGVATFNLSDLSGSATFTGAGGVTLSELHWSGARQASANTESSFQLSSPITLVAPARIERAGASLVFYPNMLVSDADVVISGNGTTAQSRTTLRAPQALNGKLLIENAAWVRTESDKSLGPALTTVVPDAITLHNSILQNGGSTTLSAARGIVVGKQSGDYGVFAAGYQAPAHLTVLGPITGPGSVHISYENSPVIFSNPANDWRGDTKVGTYECGETVWSSEFGLRLGADEVIPHGEGRGVIYLAPLAAPGNKYSQADLDLQGHAETVNAVNATYRGRVISRVPGGVLKTCGAQDMSFRGTIASGATVELRGTGRMELEVSTSSVSGELALHSGALDFAAGAFPVGGRLSLYGGTPTLVARHHETDATLSYPSNFDGTLFVGADMTLTVDAAAEPFVFGGILATDAETPHTLTVDMSEGPLLIGGSSLQTSAVLAAPVVCAKGIVATNFVWLTAALPEGVAVASGTMFTYGYAGALAADRTLDGDLRVAASDVGDGTLTVPTGRTLVFTTQRVAGGAFVDPVDGTCTYANNVILQGGTLVFEGAGTVQFNGAVRGYGAIHKEGAGSVVFGNGQNLESGCTIEIKGGTFRLPANGSLGAATIKTSDGRFGNVSGESPEVPNPVIFNAGGIVVDGAAAVMTLTGGTTNQTNISKWGDGTLRIGGTSATMANIHVRGGVLALAKENAVTYVIGCETGSVVRVEADAAMTEQGFVTLDGGTLDLNGHDLTLSHVGIRCPGSRVVNGTETPVTLTVNSATDQEFLGELSGALTLVKDGMGDWDFSQATVANTGLRAQGGTVAFAAKTTSVTSKIRFTATKSRPGSKDPPYYADTGVQFAEFCVLLNGVRVAWPEGTTAAIKGQDAAYKEGPMKAIDWNFDTKWYYGAALNNPLTITCPTTVEFDGYQFVTANDAIGRDPVSWKIEICTIVDGEEVWMPVDERKDQDEIYPTTRHAETPVFSVEGKQAHPSLPTGYPLHIQAPGVAMFVNAGDVFTALSGDGTLIARGVVAPTIATGSTFAGRISSEQPFALVYDTSALPAVTAADAETVLVNNGVAGALTFTDAGSRVNVGAFKDGTAQLGVALAGETTLVMAGPECTYSGATTVGAGASFLAGAGCLARYFRFTPLKGTGNLGAKTMQLSELRLLRGGVYDPWPAGTTATTRGANDPWPAGTTATTRGANEGKSEGAQQLVDGSVDTKCYWAAETSPVVITAPGPVYFDGYCWYSANDSMDVRNPTRWTFEYSEDGENWVMLDDQSGADVATVTATKKLAYTFDLAAGEIARTDYLSDDSAVALAAGAKGTVSAIEETLGSLSGEGTFEVSYGAVARLNVTADAAFAGTVSGAGALAKTGAAKQTLSGTVALSGELIVEAGVLNLDGATLTGVTNIVLKGGVLTGTATVDGDVKVTSAGGAYGANLTVTGALTLSGAPTLATGYTTAAVRGTAFTCGSIDVASQALFKQALSSETIPAGWKLNLTTQSTKLVWSVVPGGTILFIR